MTKGNKQPFQSTTMNHDPEDDCEEDIDPDDYAFGVTIYW